MNALQEDFDRYSASVRDALDASKHHITSVKNTSYEYEPLIKKMLRNDEPEDWNDIKNERDDYIKEIEEFALFTIAKLTLVKRRVLNNHFGSLRECYDGFKPEEAATTIQKLKNQGDKLTKKLELFQKRMARLVGEDKKRMEKFLGVMFALVIVAAIASAMTIPGVVAAVSATSAKMEGMTGMTGMAGIYAVGTKIIPPMSDTIAVQLTKSAFDEAHRMLEWLKNMQQNLEELNGCLAAVHANTKAFCAVGKADYESDRQGIHGDLESIIRQLEEIVELCNRQDDEDDDDGGEAKGQCTIM